MASIAAQGAAASGAFSGTQYLAAVGGGVPTAAQVSTAAALPYIGWAVGIAAAVIDAYYIMPALQGKGRDVARAPRLLDVPIGSNVPGAPRVWAIGGRIRVPTHVLWQSQKVRESNNSSSKGGALQQRRVYFDAAVALNDRPCQRMRQLTGNGKLLLYSTRNIFGITTNRMTLAVVGGNLRLTAQTTLDPDFTSIFAVNDAVELRDWVQTAGAAINTGYWKVVAVVQHTTTQSYIDLGPYSGQTVAGIVATAGNAFSPATIRRVDDAVFCQGGFVVTTLTTPSDPVQEYRVTATRSTNLTWNQTLGLASPLVFKNAGALTNAAAKTISSSYNQDPLARFGRYLLVGPNNLTSGTYGASATNPGYVTFVQDSGFSTGIFPGGFIPTNFFATGSETQGESSLIVADRGTGNVPGYRGVAYQGLDDFFVTQFGDSLPSSMEAIIDVDPSMDWGRAIQTIMVERCELAASTVDVAGITQRPFLGAYLRGPVPAITAIQPILIAGQLLVQDRDGVLAFTEFANADEQTIENGAIFSDFATRLDGEAAADDKITVEDMAAEDLPTKVGIRHQDPDNQYADGYQFFGLRNPDGVDHINEQEVDLAQMVLTRQEAANLAAVLLRRAWVNRRRYRFTLPASYIHLLESDLLTWTDDDGVPHVGRIVQRDIGSDFRVAVVCIAEDLDLASYVGSPVQSVAGTPPLAVPGPASVDVVVVDAPATREGENRRPGLHIAIGYNGGPWAGAAIYESVDGTTYDLVDIVGKRAVTGELTTTLGSGTTAEQVGVAALQTTVQTVEVQFTTYSTSFITSRTTKEVVSGANWVALVKPDGTTEIAAFTSAVALGGGVYELGGWLRGLRGTGNVALNTVPQCDVGTRLVLLNGDTYYREFDGELTPTALSYKVVPGGLGLDDVEPINVVHARRNALPLPPRTITKTIDGTTLTARFTVTHNWSRAVLSLGTQPPHPMDEPVESYRFTIYDSTGTQIRRVKTITASGTGTNTIRDRWIEYTSAEQSADGYTPGPSTLFTVSVEQLGEFGAGPRWFKKF
jgi:hypothetical protein